jgi:predicted negative regulator of RcsB-dependent stress response
MNSDFESPEINMNLADAHDLFGDALSALGKHFEARREYQKASELR